MRRFTSVLMFMIFALALANSPEAAWWTRDDTLVTIDGVRYTAEDFKRWWGFWNDEDLPLPKTPEPYIDWLLLAKEAERMDLAADPSFQRQITVFLKSRALLMLKHDAVDSRIEITDADVRARYEERYTPRWLVDRLKFETEAEASAAFNALRDGSLTAEELLELSPEEGGPTDHRESWVRPSEVDPGWAAIFGNLAVGEMANPSEHGGGSNLYLLKDRKDGDDEDLAKLSEGIRRNLWKEQEDALTRELILDLRRKYQVEVNEERIGELDINADDDTFTDAVVISTSQQDITEREFMAVIRRLMVSRPTAAQAAGDEEKARELKAEAVANIIAQQVIDWEALDRHYEAKEPFKWAYEFAVRHRLTRALERRLFTSEQKVSEAQIRERYEENLQRYTQPEMVKLIIIDDTQGPVAKVWADVAVGKPFGEAVREYFGREVPSREVPFNHLDPTVMGVVENLVPGETSQPFSALGSQVVVHLLERTPASPVPLEKAKVAIREELNRENFEREREAYLDLLRDRSTIEIKDRTWREIQEELGGD